MTRIRRVIPSNADIFCRRMGTVQYSESIFWGDTGLYLYLRAVKYGTRSRRMVASQYLI